MEGIEWGGKVKGQWRALAMEQAAVLGTYIHTLCTGMQYCVKDMERDKVYDRG